MVYRDLPRIPQDRKGLWVTLALVALVLLIVLPRLSQWVTDFLWYREMARTDVYWVMFWGRWVLGGAIGTFFFVIAFANVWIALRQTSNTAWYTLSERLRERTIDIVDRTLRRLIFWGCGLLTFLFALGVGRAAADYWPQFLLFSTGQQVGTTDPIFHRDIGFYLFHLPAWELLNQWLFSTLLLALAMTAVVYMTTRGLRTLRRGRSASINTEVLHLSVLLALVFLSKALGYYLGRFSVLYSNNSLFVGAGYTDVNARLPALWFMFGVAIAAALVVLINLKRWNFKTLLITLGCWIAISVVALGIYPALVQRFRVAPNELALEAPYLKNHIALTRQAYDLNKVRSLAFDPDQQVSTASLASSPHTVQNIRLWDQRPLLTTLQQLQGLRSYYQIANVDIDRYRLNGQLRQVMLAAREMNMSQIPGTQRWINRHLVYTHGYGVVMSPVNTFDPAKGEPLFLMKDIPPKSTVPGLHVKRPEIYFGELNSDYAVVRSNQQEFDYPRGEGSNEYSTYQGPAGIGLKNPLVRWLMAMRFGSLDLMVSSYITPESRILMRRQIADRAQAVAPFLFFDRDPYIVVGDDGHLYWIMDAYTRSLRYPYAQYTDLEISGEKKIRSNYVRNAVKVVIDAYGGGTRLYVTNENEPFIRAWRTVFPRLFAPLSSMPAGLQQHVRVPEGMFNALSEVYRRYHMTNLNEFYSQEDLWEIPREDIGDSVPSIPGAPVAPMSAYYIAMSLPGSSEPEYLLIRPYTPTGKQNMVAWLSARNDPDHLGEMMVYNFPKQSMVFGPEQIAARIEQMPEISQAFSLWRQSGSKVEKGNLLVIPLGQTVLYAQPIYLKAEKSQIPELKRVIVADQGQVVMRQTLEEALIALTGHAVPTATAMTETSGAPASPTPSPAQKALAQSALEHLKKAQAAQKQGDWATYGTEIELVRQNLESLNTK